MKPTLVMRAHNDMPLVAQTLAMVARQDQPFELIVFDDGSTDGTRQEVGKYTDRVFPVPGEVYIPGRVLNRGMELAQSERVVFLNADCTPQDERWLASLLAGFAGERVAAVFGRQVPRAGCWPLYARDLEETYGDGSRQRRWRHCFSMAASALRRSVWERLRFDERLRYSEDIDWTWRARRQGYEIRYVPDAVAAHSHNYSLRQFYRRQFGEGQAEALIFDWSPWQQSFFRYSLLPGARQVLSDWGYCLSRGEVGFALRAPALRLAQLLGRRAGFKTGLRGKGA